MIPRMNVVLFTISAAMLAFQVALTRFFSLAQGSHLAFMAVSLALLGAGASGTYLSLRPVCPVTLPRFLTIGSLLFTLTAPVAYLLTNYLPFDAYRLAWEPAQLLWLALYYLALTVPFFFAGAVIGVALAAQPDRAGTTYAANLLGSALGPPLALVALNLTGGPGTVFAVTLLGWLAVGAARNPRRVGWAASFTIITLMLTYFTLRPPTLFEVRLTPYKALAQAQLYPGSDIIFSRWNAFSRVDVIQSEGIRSAPGLSFAYTDPLPPQLGLTVDGDNLTPLSSPAPPDFSRSLPPALGFALRPDADVLILEPGGGLAVMTALQNGAASVTVVQSNPTVIRAVRDDFADFNDHLYRDPRVTLITEAPRSFLRRSQKQFDLIILPLTDSFRPVTAGAYTLNEDYRYTVETFGEALRHLSPEGLVLVERWLQLPPSESLRIWGTAFEAVRQIGFGAIDSQLFAIRSLQTSLIGITKQALSPQDLATIRSFATDHQFDLVWLPDITTAEANRYSIVPDAAYYRTFAQLITAQNPDNFYADYGYAIAPPTDDHPYFFHFFKWQQIPEIWQTLGKTWQPFGGSGYLVLLVLLGLVVILSAGLIVLPLLVPRIGAKSIGPSRPTIRILLYFTLLGLGFLFIEIPLLQRFILYLGQPAYAFAVVVSALLVAAGTGSRYLTTRLPRRGALLGIAGLALAYPIILPLVFNATLSLPLTGRMVVTVIALFPVGMVMGVPFPRGVMLVGQNCPELTPWAWAVNGCASVVSAVLAAIIALTWGFAVVLWSAAAAYALAAAIKWR